MKRQHAATKSNVHRPNYHGQNLAQICSAT